MYSQSGTGQTIPLTNPDEAFVRDAVTKYGSRETASEIFAAQGWGLIRDNKRESALQHFIRAWQLNDKNYQAFWGFGAILSEQGKLAEAIEQLEMARDLNTDSSGTGSVADRPWNLAFRIREANPAGKPTRSGAPFRARK